MPNLGDFSVPCGRGGFRGCFLGPLVVWWDLGACPWSPGDVAHLRVLSSDPWRRGGFGGLLGTLETWQVRAVHPRFAGGVAGFGGHVLAPLGALRVWHGVLGPLEARRVRGACPRPLEVRRVWRACPRTPAGVVDLEGVSSVPRGVAGSGRRCGSGRHLVDPLEGRGFGGHVLGPWRSGRFSRHVIGRLDAWPVCDACPRLLDAWQVHGACPRSPGGMVDLRGFSSVPCRRGGFGCLSSVCWWFARFRWLVLDPLKAWGFWGFLLGPPEAWRGWGLLLGPRVA